MKREALNTENEPDLSALPKELARRRTWCNLFVVCVRVCVCCSYKPIHALVHFSVFVKGLYLLQPNVSFDHPIAEVHTVKKNNKSILWQYKSFIFFSPTFRLWHGPKNRLVWRTSRPFTTSASHRQSFQTQFSHILHSISTLWAFYTFPSLPAFSFSPLACPVPSAHSPLMNIQFINKIQSEKDIFFLLFNETSGWQWPYGQ